MLKKSTVLCLHNLFRPELFFFKVSNLNGSLCSKERIILRKITVEYKFMFPQLGTCVKVLKAIRENKFHTVGN